MRVAGHRAARNPVPPHSHEAEQAVIGALLIDGDVIGDVASILRPDHYHGSWRAQVYRAMLELLDAGRRRIDAVTLKHHLMEKGEWTDESEARLAQDAASVPSAANVVEYARIVREMATRREALRVAREIQDLAQENGELEAIDAAHGSLGQILADDGRAAESFMVGGFGADEDPVTALARRRDGMHTGIPGLGRFLDSLVDEVLVCAGTRSVGKSTLLVQFTDGVLEAGHHVLVVAYEQSRLALEAISLARRARVNSVLVMRGGYGEEIEALLRDAQTEEYVSMIRARRQYPRRPPRNAGDLTRLVKTAQQRVPEGRRLVLCIDALQNMPGEAGICRREQIDRIMNFLQNELAKPFEVPVWVNCHLSREGELKESSGIDDGADIILKLQRDEKVDEGRDVADDGSSYPVRRMELKVAKNRDGECGIVPLDFHTAIRDFREASGAGHGR
jgi:replicative DNA helicase